ncbi:MAG: YbaB/EbfC family nucleoid-associated protein [Bacteroidetes bacterium]|nr:YbaB/EbfC family nucleoid-associated protein [Bacteroidota bacterium]
MFDMFKMLGRVGEIKEKMGDAKAKLKTIEITESELDGVVVVTISGDKVVKSISTSEEFYTTYSKSERESILTEAVNNAIQKAEASSKQIMAEELKDVMPDIPGLDINNLPFGL